MTENLIARTPSAYGYPLLIKQLFEAPLALVVLKPGDADGGAEKAILHFVKDYADKGFVSKHALLLKIKIVEAIDKTGVGKTNKVELRRKHL